MQNLVVYPPRFQPVQVPWSEQNTFATCPSPHRKFIACMLNTHTLFFLYPLHQAWDLGSTSSSSLYPYSCQLSRLQTGISRYSHPHANDSGPPICMTNIIYTQHPIIHYISYQSARCKEVWVGVGGGEKIIAICRIWC